MKAFVTGADGFIGSHLVEGLLQAGHEVTGLALYNRDLSYGWLEGIDCPKVLGDIRDSDLTARQIEGHDVVFHLAALIDVPYSGVAAQSYLDTNVQGTANVVRACLDHGAKLIFASSSEVYGTAQTEQIAEDHPLVAQSPYAASKIAGEKWIEAATRWHGLEAVILRVFNTYGPRQSERAVIASVCKQLSMSSHIEFGNPDAQRDWLYIDDAVRAYLKALDLPGGVWNVATGRCLRVGDMVLEAEHTATGTYGAITISAEKTRPATGEVERLCGDAGKFHRMTGWKPGVMFSDGLRRTLAWWQERYR